MWALVGVFVVSLGRWIAYALAAGTLAQKLSSQGAGARPAVVAAISLGAALAATATGLWLVAAGLRERSRLELDGWAASSRPFSARRLLARSAALSAVTIVVFTTVESLIHYEDGPRLPRLALHRRPGAPERRADHDRAVADGGRRGDGRRRRAGSRPPRGRAAGAGAAARRARPARGLVRSPPGSAPQPLPARDRPHARPSPRRPDHGHAGPLRPALVGGIA